MRRCPDCTVDVEGGWTRCPLCGSALEGRSVPSPYPAVPLRFTRRRVLRVLALTSLAVIALSFLAQLLFRPDQQGIGALRTDATLQEVLPGATVERTVQVDARALLWNTIEVDTSSFAVDETPGSTQSLEAHRFAAPWTLLIVCALVLTVAIVLGVRLGRRSGTGSVAPAKADAASER